jgi:ATP-dependent helicase/nuclease subunit A
MRPMHEATIAQVAAARPEVSTWLAANAGSGKTRVLIDRVARLLLNGVQPQHILCLTYTKAAATEMQNRLFQRLGAWAMKPDADLRADLAELGEGAGLTADRIALARQLFARAIETPGGLRIQTIHSFCATLLRRYPLEAGVSPGFAEMDDRTARQIRDDIVQDMADRSAPEAVAGLARHYTSEDLDTLLLQICGKAAEFAAPLGRADVWRQFGLHPDDTQDAILGDVFLGDEADILAELVAKLALGLMTDAKNADELAVFEPYLPSPALLGVLEGLFLLKSGENAGQAKIGKFPTKDLRNALGSLRPRLESLMGRVENARARRVAHGAAEKTFALHQFAVPFLAHYGERKAARGMLDFDDLITRAGQLLHDPGLAAWVLFRLDGGIDHILVDEAQDTSPAQWAVIERLAAEFTAGIGASDTPRTLFVVGDKKQSIYSFQGADLTAFDARRDDFRARFNAVGQPMQDRALDHSFRSSRAILDVVDATFGDAFPLALGDAPRHLAFKDTLPGRVDLWPLIPAAEKPKDEDGWSPVDLISEDHHTVALAQQVAGEIRSMIDGGVQVPDQMGAFHPVHEGDFLILVQRRGPIFSHIIRACKQRGLAIAGADRLKLGEELAVKDLKSLLSFLVTPEDSLSLAAALRSPLFGWSEDQLYRLAQGRRGYLWAALRAADAPETQAVLHDLRNQADFLRPYEMLERILTRHNGRQRLLTRLGDEAEDGIDELLAQSLIYEQADVPSLTGFLIWLENDEVQVKRQVEGEGRRIRVMTVHGAKGLEAPIVILPDTADRNPQDRDEIFALESGFPVWKTATGESPEAIDTVRATRKAKAREESLRLLYVALTRARCWLIVAGAGDAKTEANKKAKPRDDWCWYRQVEAGMAALGALQDGGRLRHQFAAWADAGVRQDAPTPATRLPDWALLPAPEVARPAQPLSPSDLGGAKALAGEGDEPEVAKARGTAVHALLEHLPGIPAADWPALAQSLAPPGQDGNALLAEAAGVLGDPALSVLFGPDTLAEVTLTADLNGARVVGVLDRLILSPEQVLAVDFKTNRVVPRSAAEVPEGILRQMGAYVVALRQIYPGRRVEVAVLWTAAPLLMSLDPDIVSLVVSRAAIS